MKPEHPVHQPKMLQRIQLRYALGLLGVAALLAGWVLLKGFFQNNGDFGHNDTSGWIVALRQTGSGEQVVAVKQDDSVVDSPGYTDGEIDRDPTFDNAGERIFFVTGDRDKTTRSLQIYRWNPGRNSIDQRTSGKLAEEHPAFEDTATPGGSSTMLVVKAGVVVEFNPQDGIAHQLVPVEGRTPTQSGGDDKGMGTQFGPEYEHLGSSFREAHWCKNRRFIAGIMHGDDGETLVVICVQPGANPGPLEDGLPHGIIKGGHIDMAVDPTSGNIAYTVDDFRFVDPNSIPPSMIKGGKAIRPFRNVVGLFNPDDPKSSGAIAVWPDEKRSFGQPAVSPDGAQVAFVAGADTNDGFKSLGLVVAPFAIDAGRQGKMLFAGDVASPSWSPDGKQIAFGVTAPDGHGDIAVVPAEGGAPKVPTAGKGSFASPHFSPMRAKAGS